jgi:3-isopropylmalate dehydrogenase
LWRACAEQIAAEEGVECLFLDIDHAAYHLLQHARDLDLLVAPNLFGDILCDLGGVLMGSRGLTYSANFTPAGAGVYQTNHGAAYDLAGTDRANPAGQILSLAMLLHESCGLSREAGLIERALADVWKRGFRTADLDLPGARVIGTREMAERVADAVVEHANAMATA